MSSPILIVSDPPHHEVDLGRAAAIVGLNPYETRLKLIFPAPEVLAGADMDRAKEIAASYESVGVRVTIIAKSWPTSPGQNRFLRSSSPGRA